MTTTGSSPQLLRELARPVPRAVVVIVTVVMLAWGGTAEATQRPGRATVTRSAPEAPPTQRRVKPPKPTPYDRLLGKVSPETGLPSKRNALRLFSALFGRVPGVKVAPVKQRGIDATTAVRWVMGYFDQYTPKQQQAIRRLLEPPPETETVELAQSTGRPPGPTTLPPSPARAVFAAAPTPSGAEVVAWAEEFRTAFAADERLGPIAQPPMTLNLAPPRLAPNPRWWYVSWAEPRPDGSCVINVAERSRMDIARAVFHCYQFVIRGATGSSPAWVESGSAEFAALDVANGSSVYVGMYTRNPTKPLYSRTDDALGFYAHLKQVGINPYKAIRNMLPASSSPEAIEASGAQSDAFLNSWASSYFAGELPGPEWTMEGPGVDDWTRYRARPVNKTVVVDTETTISVPGWTNQIYRLKTDADVIEVTMEPGPSVSVARIADGTNDYAMDLQKGGSFAFCLRQRCVCPSEDVSGGSGLEALGGAGPVEYNPLKRSARMAITGGLYGFEDAKVTISAFSFESGTQCCAGPTRTVRADGLTFTPRVGCRVIGLKIQHGPPLKLELGVGLLVNRPRLRLVYRGVGRERKLDGVRLHGVNGLVIDFGAGMEVQGANRSFRTSVPIEVSVPVMPRERGAPATMKVTWKVLVKTAFGSANSTLWARGRYGLQDRVPGLDGGVLWLPTFTVENSILDSIGGITLAPGGIVFSVKTQFRADKGTPRGMRGVKSSFQVTVGVTQGSVLASRAIGGLVTCRGARMTVYYDAGGGPFPDMSGAVADREAVSPEGTAVCGSIDASR